MIFWIFCCLYRICISIFIQFYTLGFIFEKKPSIRDNRSKYNDKLCQPVPGHPELTSNKMAQIWNNLQLNNAKSIADVRASALEWYRTNLQDWLLWYLTYSISSFYTDVTTNRSLITSVTLQIRKYIRNNNNRNDIVNERPPISSTAK